jgi:PPM family protein phosphatase
MPSFGNAQHAGARDTQQDSFGFSDPFAHTFVEHGGLLAVVADGMGGMAHGDLASRTAVRVFLEAYAEKTAEEPIPDALLRALSRANEAVLVEARRVRAVGDVGTTLVAAVLRNSELHWISAGDSAIFIHGADGLTLVTRSHVYAEDLDRAVAAGAVSEEAAASHPERESLTSFVGAVELKQVDRSIRPLPLREGDTALLASDGLFKTLSAAEIAEQMSGPLQERCDRLVSRVVGAGRPGQDNITVVAISGEEAIRAALPATGWSSAVLRGRRPVRPRLLRAALLFAMSALAAGAGYFLHLKGNHAPAVPAIEAGPERFDTSKAPPYGPRTEPSAENEVTGGDASATPSGTAIGEAQ